MPGHDSLVGFLPLSCSLCLLPACTPVGKKEKMDKGIIKIIPMLMPWYEEKNELSQR